MGGIFSYTDSTVANFRQKDDAINGAIGGCAAGVVLGAAARSVPMMFGGCASLAALIGTFDAAGKSLQGTYARPSANDFSHDHDAAPGAMGWREAREARRQSFFKVRSCNGNDSVKFRPYLTNASFSSYSRRHISNSKRRRMSNPMHRSGRCFASIQIVFDRSSTFFFESAHSQQTLLGQKNRLVRLECTCALHCNAVDRFVSHCVFYDKEAPTKSDVRTPFSVLSRRGFLSASGSAASGRAPTQAHCLLSVVV